MRDLKLDIDIVDGYFAMDAEGAVHDSWRRIKELVEEKFTSTNSKSMPCNPQGDGWFMCASCGHRFKYYHKCI